MPIKNYTTIVDITRTVAEISHLLASHGARSVRVDYNGKRQPDALGFDFPVGRQMIHFRLPANMAGVLEVLKTQPGVDPRYRSAEHAQKVAWRILKDWVAAQMAIVEAGAAQLAEVFLPYTDVWMVGRAAAEGAAEMVAQTKVQTWLERRDELVKQIFHILRPQLDGQPVVSDAQREELNAALALFTSEVRGE